MRQPERGNFHVTGKGLGENCRAGGLREVDVYDLTFMVSKWDVCTLERGRSKDPPRTAASA
jgi:hypothetical protein